MGVLEAGKIYILITEPPGKDPDGVTDIGVEGTGHVVMDIPERITQQASSKKKVYDFPGEDGDALIQSLGYWSNRFKVTGSLKDTSQALTLARQGNWLEFVHEEREDVSLYLAICFGANVYWRDYDNKNSTQRQYSEGAFVDNDVSFYWVNAAVFSIQCTFTWKSNW